MCFEHSNGFQWRRTNINKSIGMLHESPPAHMLAQIPAVAVSVARATDVQHLRPICGSSATLRQQTSDANARM